MNLEILVHHEDPVLALDLFLLLAIGPDHVYYIAPARGQRLDLHLLVVPALGPQQQSPRVHFCENCYLCSSPIHLREQDMRIGTQNTFDENVKLLSRIVYYNLFLSGRRWLLLYSCLSVSDASPAAYAHVR